MTTRDTATEPRTALTAETLAEAMAATHSAEGPKPKLSLVLLPWATRIHARLAPAVQPSADVVGTLIEAGQAILDSCDIYSEYPTKVSPESLGKMQRALAAARLAPAAAEPDEEWTWKGDYSPGDRHGAGDGWVHTHADGTRWVHPDKVCPNPEALGDGAQ